MAGRRCGNARSIRERTRKFMLKWIGESREKKNPTQKLYSSLSLSFYAGDLELENASDFSSFSIRVFPISDPSPPVRLFFAWNSFCSFAFITRKPNRRRQKNTRQNIHDRANGNEWRVQRPRCNVAATHKITERQTDGILINDHFVFAPKLRHELKQ